VIIVTGTVRARPDTIDEVEALSLEHVRRSRQEPGCISHSVHRDLEDRLRLVFVEWWADTDVLLAHFGVEESAGFVTAVGALTDEPPGLSVYAAEEVPLRDLAPGSRPPDGSGTA
jgi:quinol monooxygenase YgiN